MKPKPLRILSYSFRPNQVYRGGNCFSNLVGSKGLGSHKSSTNFTEINRYVLTPATNFTLEVHSNYLPFRAVVRRWAARRVRVAIKRQAQIEDGAGHPSLSGHLVIYAFAPLVEASGEAVMNEARNIIAACRDRNSHFSANPNRSSKQKE